MDIKLVIEKKLEEIKKIITQTENYLSADLLAVEKNLSLILTKLENRNSNDPPHPTTKEKILVWADGACSNNPGPGGWGAIVYHEGKYSEFSGFSPQSTNNIMEMTAALEGIRQTPEGAKVSVITDSQYVLKGITQWIHGWKKKGWKKADGKAVLNRKLWRELDYECCLRSVDWKWVKGHTGDPYNERCDELAREAISSNKI